MYAYRIIRVGRGLGKWVVEATHAKIPSGCGGDETLNAVHNFIPFSLLLFFFFVFHFLVLVIFFFNIYLRFFRTPGQRRKIPLQQKTLKYFNY